MGRLTAAVTKEPLGSALLLLGGCSGPPGSGLRFGSEGGLLFVVGHFGYQVRSLWLGFPPFFQSAAAAEAELRCRSSTEKPSSVRNLPPTCGRTRRSSSARSHTRSSGATSKCPSSPVSPGRSPESRWSPLWLTVGRLANFQTTYREPSLFRVKNQTCADEKVSENRWRTGQDRCVMSGRDRWAVKAKLTELKRVGGC